MSKLTLFGDTPRAFPFRATGAAARVGAVRETASRSCREPDPTQGRARFAVGQGHNIVGIPLFRGRTWEDSMPDNRRYLVPILDVPDRQGIR